MKVDRKFLLLAPSCAGHWQHGFWQLKIHIINGGFSNKPHLWTPEGTSKSDSTETRAQTYQTCIRMYHSQRLWLSGRIWFISLTIESSCNSVLKPSVLNHETKHCLQSPFILQSRRSSIHSWCLSEWPSFVRRSRGRRATSWDVPRSLQNRKPAEGAAGVGAPKQVANAAWNWVN